MRVSHARHNGFAFEIDDARVFADVLLRVTIRTYKNNAVTFYGDRFRPRLTLIDAT